LVGYIIGIGVGGILGAIVGAFLAYYMNRRFGWQ
jgi:hypothetical protein